MFDYKLIRSDRKTLSVEIDRDGGLIVRAPRRLDKATIERFLESRKRWIEENRRRMLERRAAVVQDSSGAQTVWYHGSQLQLLQHDASNVEIRDGALIVPHNWTQAYLRAWLKEMCKQELQSRVPPAAALLGVQPTAIHVTEAKTRWGSCSSKNSLNFSWRLIFCPPEVMDYVVIHELCHIRHKNHSAAFWAMVAQYDPDYKTHRAWLREHAALMDLF